MQLEGGLRSTSGHLVTRGVMELVNLYILGSNQESTTRETYDALLSSLANMEGPFSAVFLPFSAVFLLFSCCFSAVFVLKMMNLRKAYSSSCE